MAGVDQRNDSLNDRIAVIAALLSAVLALTSIEAGSVSDEQRYARLGAMDQWNQYQAKRMRQFLLEANLAEVVALRSLDAGPALDRAIVDWQSDIVRYEAELKEIAEEAKTMEASAESAARRGTLLGRAEMILTLALALFAVTALTRVNWLFNGAALLGLVGTLYSAAGWWPGGWTHVLP